MNDGRWLFIFCLSIIVIALALGFSISDFRKQFYNPPSCETTEIGKINRKGDNYVSVVFSMCPDQITYDAFNAAADKWSSIITDNSIQEYKVGSLGLDTDQACSFLSRSVFFEEDTVFDHLVIVADVYHIDSTGGVLAQAAPCASDELDKFPVLSGMLFDLADLKKLHDNGQLETILLHEMGHALGFGTNWASKAQGGNSGGSGFALLQDPIFDSRNNPNPQNIPHFIGQNAVAEYNALKSGSDVDSVPVEDGRRDGEFTQFHPDTNRKSGLGAIDKHWHEEAFGNEIMIYAFSPSRQYPLSAVTLASFQDLGYSIDMSAAEDFELPQSKSSNLRGGETDAEDMVYLQGDVPATTVRPLRYFDASNKV